jgi:hypothetical protein
VSATQRIQRLVDPAYSSDLDDRDLATLREMRAECAAVETAVSYTRRLAQGRVEIFSAEQARRKSGGSVHDLVADLPRILGEERGRSSAADARLVEPEEPELDIDWGSRSALIADESLATLDDIADADLVAMVAALRDFERELSDYRQDLHRVLDGLDRELGARAVGGVG